MCSKKTTAYSSEYEDGFAFQFEIPKEDLSLQAVCIEDDAPVLLFEVAKKVPTISESDVATCIRLSLDYKRPEFFYTSFLPDHPLAGAGRHYKYYKPEYLRRTSIGETLANLDWHMKCLNIGVRGDKERGIFRSWAATSNLEGLASREFFPQDSTEPSSVFMTCKEVCTYNDESQLVFVKDPKIAIDQQHNPGYSNYVTQNFDSIAYYDEPLFFKMKEIIKLTLAAEWLRDKRVQFSKKWLEEHASNLQDTPKPLQVELSEEQIAVITKELQQGAEEALRNPALMQPSLSLSKFKDRFSVTQSITQVKNGCIEANVEKTFADPYLETTTELYVPVVQKLRIRASICDLDFVYEGMDPNMPVILDTETGELVKPDVKSWSELYCETEPFPCKWLQDPNDSNLRTPALTGGVSTSSIPVRNVSAPVSVPSKNTVRVKATKERKKQRVRSRDIPPQPVVNAPSNDARVSRIESQQNAVARGGAQEMCGHEDLASCYGVSSDGNTIVKQPSLHRSDEIVQLIGGKEVGPPLHRSMHLPLPPQKEPSDSAYSSIASTPSSSSQQRGLSEARFDKDDRSSVTSDSGVSTATLDTLCNSDSDDTQADDHMDIGN